MSTVEKGNKLEDNLYAYLLDQKEKGLLVYDSAPPQLCKIYKKKKYSGSKREIEFDVVIEMFRSGASSPWQYIVFECKNHARPVQDRDVRDFSSKIHEVFKHRGKGVVVTTSRLQSGATSFADEWGLGIVKYEHTGFETIAERKGGVRAETAFIKSQIVADQRPLKPMKFSSFYAGNYLSSVDQFLQRMDAKFSSMDASSKATGASVPFLTIDEIGHSVESVLNAIEYANGEVDLERICSILSIELVRSGEEIKADDGQIILGVASFDQKSIQINLNGDGARERFTIGHELGHFCLRHDRYLRSETLVETDLIAVGDQERSFNFERLEIQANMFASDLLLPRKQFFRKVEEFRSLLDITDRGHGYIYVDDQPCNLQDYYKLLTFLKMEFGVSKQAIEVKLKRLGMLNDQRNKIGSPFNFVLGEGRL